jgi:uncharacterized protein DUF3309
MFSSFQLVENTWRAVTVEIAWRGERRRGARVDVGRRRRPIGAPRVRVVLQRIDHFADWQRHGFSAACRQPLHPKETAMTLGTILLIVLILLLLGAVPSWPYSRGWGYGPSGGLGLVLVVVIVLLLMGRI